MQSAPTRHQAWIGEGLVSALVSGDTPSAPLRAALALEAAGLMPLEASWRLGLRCACGSLAGMRTAATFAPACGPT